MLSMEQRVLIDTTLAEAKIVNKADYTDIVQMVMQEVTGAGEPFDPADVKAYIRKKFIKQYVLEGENSDRSI